jgi:hypothetical protein
METCLIKACPSENAEALFAVIPLVFTCFGILLLTAAVILCVVAFCKIFQKAGYSWALGLLMLVPIARLVALLYLAFAQWPIEKQLSSLKAPQENSTS